jgi:hypothetical protein
MNESGATRAAAGGRAADLPGQSYLFADMAPAAAAADEMADAVRLLGDGLPDKQTVNMDEAARLMACCRRTVDNWIADGTLIAMYANRADEARRKHARIVVRAARPYDPTRKNYLTLAELRVKRSNVGGN